MMVYPGMMRLTNGVKLRLALCVALGLGLSGVSVVRGFLTADVIDRVFAGENPGELLPILAAILGLAVCIALFSQLKRGAEMLVAASVKQHLRPRLFARLAALGPGYLDRTGSGKAQATLVDGVEALEGYFGSYVPQVLITLAVPAAILGYLFTLDAWVGLTITTAVIIALFAPKLWEKLLGSYGQDHWNAYSELNGRFVDSMQGMTTLVAFNAAGRRGRELADKAWSLYRATMRQLAVSLMNTGIVGLAMKGGSAAALGVAAVRVTQGHLTLEQLLIILFLAAECIRPLADLDRAWHAGYMGISAATGIFEILDAPAAITTPKPVSLPAGELPRIDFQGVHFAYDSRKGKVLHGLDLTLEAGKTTALVGASGAGKS
ncbi:MAG: ABC transporter transmembrane domain-containing protein, partial [Acidobacteriota bacterium]|nr:ABC transporter transmembrane domain-containing protein [Acidobacteriota bacterium]